MTPFKHFEKVNRHLYIVQMLLTRHNKVQINIETVHSMFTHYDTFHKHFDIVSHTLTQFTLCSHTMTQFTHTLS